VGSSANNARLSPSPRIHIIHCAVTGFRDKDFQWQYFNYLSQSGWGIPYQYPYTLPVVLTYLAAYGTGLATYIIAWQNGSRIVSAIGVLLCAIGFASFAYELTHWFSEHYCTWVVSLPAPLLLLAVAAAIQHYRFPSSLSGGTNTNVT
jgi:hypothetical protein